MQFSRLGVWFFHGAMTSDACAAFARRVEAWGYGTLWLPEGSGRDPFIGSSAMLAATKHLTLATGIASIYARDALASKNAQHALNEQFPARFVLALGGSHARLVEVNRGGKFDKSPLAAMRGYLQQLAQLNYDGPAPTETPITMIAALGPRMLELAHELTDGAHTYHVTPDHTEMARTILGPDRVLCPEQLVLLESDPTRARAIARDALKSTLALPNYRQNYLRMGFTDSDLDGGGSDRFIDGIVAWGDEDRIRERVRQHWDAGATQVCIQSLPQHGRVLTANDERVFALLAADVTS